MATYNFPPADLTPTQADALVRGLCEELELDYSKVKLALDAGSTVVRVALMGESGGWPEEHIRTARAEFGQRLPKTVDLGSSPPGWPINNEVLVDLGRLLDDGVTLGSAQQRWVVAAANALSNALDEALPDDPNRLRDLSESVVRLAAEDRDEPLDAEALAAFRDNADALAQDVLKGLGS